MTGPGFFHVRDDWYQPGREREVRPKGDDLPDALGHHFDDSLNCTNAIWLERERVYCWTKCYRAWKFFPPERRFYMQSRSRYGSPCGVSWGSNRPDPQPCRVTTKMRRAPRRSARDCSALPLHAESKWSRLRAVVALEKP